MMKKKVHRSELFLGRPVRVPLSLTTDPAEHKGSFGIILEADWEQDKAIVQFEGGNTGYYQFNALETLYPKKALLYSLSMVRAQKYRDEIDTFRKIVSLVIQGAELAALKLAYSNLRTEEFAVTRLDQLYEMKRDLRKYAGIKK
ncbi:hypothetical protein [Edaphocola aurantiacus]|uniref:hypothetical protein n=1 Tax=Edaphocola aurantiacus TaxID=2601682 RepID=UPI001C96B2E6|nr:hypothetical protein [Edaphocola aurantiacus]